MIFPWINGLFFPDIRYESISLPIYKKVTQIILINDRGISISDVSREVFSFIINRRFQDFIEDFNITGE